jgi:prepilin-type N-terminal cleavage/methylation domain-containing protein
MRRVKLSQTGFTIIELMIATIIFAVVLMVIIASFMQVGRMFYKGVSLANTNEAARTLVDDISNDLKLNKQPVGISTAGTKKYFCAGHHRYTFVLAGGSGSKVSSDDIDLDYLRNPFNMRAGIVQDDTNGGCSPPASSDSPGRQILGPDMQLNDLDFTPGFNGVFIHTHIVFYGVDDTVFDTNISSFKNSSTQPSNSSHAPDAFCSGDLLSTQFCAAADIKTTIATGF